MARGINKVILIGNLGQDPEVRFTPSGTAVANLNLATTDTWMDRQSGQRQERTEWHRVVMFNKTAEIAQQYLKKGSKVYIEGRLQTRKWQDQNGQDRYSTDIVANDMQMLDGRSGDYQGGGAPQNNYSQNAPQNAPSMRRLKIILLLITKAAIPLRVVRLKAEITTLAGRAHSSHHGPLSQHRTRATKLHRPTSRTAATALRIRVTSTTSTMRSRSKDVKRLKRLTRSQYSPLKSGLYCVPGLVTAVRTTAHSLMALELPSPPGHLHRY